MTEQERTLIAGCAKGEKAAWDAFVRQYSNLVYHTIRKTLTLHHAESRADAVDDLYQEFFVFLLKDNCKKLSQFRGDGGCTLASWLRVVASRLTIDFLRKQPAPTVEVTVSYASDEADASDSMIDREKEMSLSQALDGLSPRDRLIIQLSFRQALPPEEIAAILKMSIGAVYTQKSRVLDKLREVLTKNPLV
jgi:RNA polymerase sigma factor (sigma-70 family)